MRQASAESECGGIDDSDMVHAEYSRQTWHNFRRQYFQMLKLIVDRVQEQVRCAGVHDGL